MKRPARPATPPPVEVHVRQQDILSAEADESVALPVSERGLGVTLPVATRLLARLSREK